MGQRARRFLLLVGLCLLTDTVHSSSPKYAKKAKVGHPWSVVRGECSRFHSLELSQMFDTKGAALEIPRR